MKLVIASLFLIFGSNLFAQTLADIARQERQRQKAATSKVTVGPSPGGVTTTTTTATTTPTAAAPAPAAAGQEQKEKPESATPAEVTDNQGRGEKYWRTAFQQARDDLRRAEMQVQIMDLRIKELNTAKLQRSDIYNRELRLDPEITAAQLQLENAQKAVEASQKKIADLEEELRRSGGLPGWAR
jgi:phage-related minor tail protein